MEFNKKVTRRQVLGGGLLGLAALAIPVQGFGRADQILSPERAISLHNLHTGEELRNATFWAQGEYLPDSLQDLNWLLRDHRTDQVHPIDPALFDLLYGINRQLSNREPVQIISGYRSPETNRALRSSGNGVAKYSLHMEGKALDIRVGGCALKDLRKTAKAMRVGGVGYYPDSRFVHVDTGRVRYW